MATETHDPGPPVGARDGGPFVAAEESVTPAKTGNCEADPSVPLPSGHDLVRDSIDKAAKEEVGDDTDMIATKMRIIGFSDGAAGVLAHERNSGDLPHRLNQAMLHSALTDARIGELEKELYQLRQKVNGLPDDWKPPKKHTMHPVYDHKLVKLSASQFRISEATFESKRESRPALEVLINEHIQDESSSGITVQGEQTTFRGTPEQIRIRTRPLARLLLLEIGSAAILPSKLSPPRTGEPESSTVILRPFKIFVTYEQQIRRIIRHQAEPSQETEQASDSQDQSAKLRNEKDYETEDLEKDRELLGQFMDEDLRPLFQLRRAINDYTAKEIEYGDLWHLFKRGDIVMSQVNAAHAYRVVNFTGGREPLTRSLSSPGRLEQKPNPVQGFAVDCLSILYDGSNYVPKLTKLSISPYLGRRAILSLAVYPMRFLPDYDKKSKALADQGRLYQNLNKVPFSYKTVRGKTLDEPSHDIDNQVVVDIAYAIYAKPALRPEPRISTELLTQSDQRETEMRPPCVHMPEEGCCGGDVIFKDLEMDRSILDTYLQQNTKILGPRSTDDLSNDDLMLLPNWTYGFVLRTRRWVKLAISDLSEPEFENDFKNLMLPERSKNTIRSLVLTHEQARDQSSTASLGSGIDLVKGKGTGLILLLHGEPGVGKTSTAECVADNTKRPLFPITCGDIGETAMEVEESLQNHFRMAHKWGCVLLLDEADIFLAKRTKLDIRRNAITSVFLRSLEYYQGILFLTTNRVGGIDPAFKSRIHMSILFKRFDLESSVRLYAMFIERTKAEQKRLGREDFTIKKKEILRFAKRHYREMEAEGLGCWNGRQIRNAFQAAIALCEYEGQERGSDQHKPELGRSHFETVAGSSKEFDRYLIETLGAPESDIASREEWRSDRFGALPGTSRSQVTARKPAPPSSRSRGKAPAASVELSESSSEGSSDEDSDGSDNQDSDDGESRAKTPAAPKQSAEDEFREFQEFKRMKAKTTKNS